MAFKLTLRREAEKDLTEAFEYYQSCRPGLGLEFMLCVEAALGSIQRNPEHYPQVYKNVARNFIRRFPFGIYFLIKQDAIIVLAALHVRRNPRDWQSRI